MAFPAKTTLYLNTKSNSDPDPNTNSLVRYNGYFHFPAWDLE